MRILSVVAYLSADGAYGGPVAVALDQARALQAAGHEVTVAGGWDGAATWDSTVRVRCFRAVKPLRGSFVGLVAPGLLAWVPRNARTFDVVHVHLTRDLLTLPAAALAARMGVPVVLQTHGQIRAERSRLQAVLDRLLTTGLFRRAAAFLVFDAAESADLTALGAPGERLHVLRNGVPAATEHASPPEERPLVLFSGRLAARKRPRAFVATAELVVRERPDARFEIQGPDGGELAAVLADIQERGLADVCRYVGASTAQIARRRLAGAAVFVFPSEAEPFGMALLEAMSAGVPCVTTEDTGLSEPARAAGAAHVTDGTPERMAEAVLALLDSPDEWHRSSAAALSFAAGYGMDHIAQRLVGIYSAVRGPRGPADVET